MRGPFARLLLLLLSGLAAPAGAATRYVARSGLNVVPYTNWANAATNLSAVVTVATNNDVIFVSNGVFVVASTVSITQTGLTLRSVNGPDATAIDGGGRVGCLTIGQSGIKLIGLTVQNGSNAANGAAVSVATNRTGILISNCVIQSSYASADGGGVYFPSSAGGVVVDTRFARNKGMYGGGLCLRGAGVVVSNCTFSENGAEGGPGTGGAGIFLGGGGTVVQSVFERNVSTGNDGGGVLVNAGAPLIDRCRFEDNTADDWGGGLASYGGTAVVQNAIFVGNHADEGGAILFNAGGIIRNCTMIDNRANLLVSSGGGINLQSGAVENCVIYHNSPNNVAVPAALRLTNCCAAPLPAGSGNFTNDPALLHRADRVLWPATNSPCLNAGVSRTWMTGAADYSGQARTIGSAPDVGAYEVGALVGYFTATPDHGAPPLDVGLVAYVTGTNTTSLGRRWDFTNDGAFDTLGLAVAGTTNSYAAAGVYSVRLVATNGVGQSATVTRTNLIAVQPVRYVAPGGGHVSPFTNWVTAATNIEAALAIAGERGTVLVSNGTYALSAELALTGSVTVASVNGPDATRLAAPTGARIARLEPGALLAGFALSGGQAPAAGDYAGCGGALLLRYGGVASNLAIVGSSAGVAGGGVCLAGGGLLTHSVVAGNQAAAGGGVAVFSGGDVVNCRLETNRATGTGGGVYLSGNSVTRNVLLAGNDAATNGGGAAIVRSGGTLENCTVLRNTGGGNGGGVYCEDAGNVQNCLIISNSAAAGGNWYTNAGSGGYGFFFTYTCTAPTTGLPNATGCTSNAPNFRNAATNDFRLLPGSAGSDAGSTLAWMSGATDLAGESRVIGSSVDMGAYEAPGLLLEITNIVDGARLPFRSTYVVVAGRGYNLSGTMGYTNRAPAQTAVSNFPAATAWSATAWLPAKGRYTLTVFATNSSGVATQQTVTIQRQRSQLFWVEP